MPIPYNYISQLFQPKQGLMSWNLSNYPSTALGGGAQGMNLDAINAMIAHNFRRFYHSPSGGTLDSMFGAAESPLNLSQLGQFSGSPQFPGGGGGGAGMGGRLRKFQKSFGNIYDPSTGVFTNPVSGATFDVNDPGSTLEALNEYISRNFGFNDVYQMLSTRPNRWGEAAYEVENPRFDPTTGALTGPLPKDRKQAERYQAISSSMASFLTEQQRQNAIAESQRMLGLAQGAYPGSALSLQMPFAQNLLGIYGGTQFQPGDFSYFLQRYLNQENEGGMDTQDWITALTGLLGGLGGLGGGGGGG